MTGEFFLCGIKPLAEGFAAERMTVASDTAILPTGGLGFLIDDSHRLLA